MWEVIKLAVAAFQVAANRHIPGLRAELLKDISRCRIDRPRRNRQFPRAVKRKMSNYKLKGPEDKETQIDLTIEFVDEQAQSAESENLGSAPQDGATGTGAERS